MRTRSSRGPPSLDGFGWAMCVIKTIVCYTALEVQIWEISYSPKRKFRSNGRRVIQIPPFLNFVETGDKNLEIYNVLQQLLIYNIWKAIHGKYPPGGLHRAKNRKSFNPCACEKNIDAITTLYKSRNIQCFTTIVNI